MKNIIQIIAILFLSFYSFDLYAQEKKTPDIFIGFRQFEFYTTITEYYEYNYKLVERKGDENTYEITLPFKESEFLETRITKILIKQYKQKIIRITILLEKDIEEILSQMFEDTYDRSYINDYGPFSPPRFRNPEPPKYSDWQKTEIDTIYRTNLSFNGHKTYMIYGTFNIVKKYSVLDENWPFEKRYIRKSKTLFETNYLTFLAAGYKEKLDIKKTQEHYDTYLSDFGLKHYPKENEDKLFYKIPLFEHNNLYYVRVLFGDVVENLVFDTGADQLIISNDLYKKLKNNNIVTDMDSSSSIEMITASGDIIKLKKVIINNFQLYDLKIDYIEAYVNTSDDISLLGQSVLKRFGSIIIDHKTNILTIKK